MAHDNSIDMIIKQKEESKKTKAELLRKNPLGIGWMTGVPLALEGVVVIVQLVQIL